MNDCALCLGYGGNASHRDSSVKVTFFDNLAAKDIAKALNGDLTMLEKYANQYVVLSEDGRFLGSGKSYNQLFTSGKIRDTEVKVYHVPPRDCW